MSSFRNQNGIGMVEVLIASAIGIAAMSASFFLINKSGQVMKSNEESRAVWFPLNDTLSRSKSLLLDVKDSKTQKNTEGVCSLMSSKTPGYGVGLVRMDLSPNSLSAAFGRRWGQFFNDKYEIGASNCQASGPFEKCLTPKQKLLDESGALFDRSSVFVKVKISPVSLAPTNGKKVFSPITSKTADIDVKMVGFLIRSEIHYKTAVKESSDPQSKGWQTNQASSMVWAADVTYCDYDFDNETVRLFPSGTGLGDTTGKVQYNRANFNVEDVEPLNVILQKKVIQAGTLTGGRIRTDENKNIEVACNEVQFRCANASRQDRVFSENMFLEALINYTQPNKVTGRGNVPMTLDLDFVSTGTSDAIARHGAKTKIYWDNVEYQKARQRLYQVGEDGQILNRQLNVSGSHNVRFDIGNSGAMCRSICSDRNMAQRSLSYRPRIRYTLFGVSSSQGRDLNYSDKFQSPSPVGCTACYMKNCSRFGLGTFGPMTEQPYEPNDSVIPECAMNEAADMATPVALKKTDVRSSAPETCIAARATAGGFEYHSTPCSQKLPVLCYNYGRHLLAQRVTTRSSSFVLATHGESDRVCYEMGSEGIDKAQLGALFDQQSRIKTHLNSLPARFINNSKQGIFFAPQNSRHITDAANWVQSAQNIGSRLFWVNLRQDKDGHVFAQPPQLSTRNAIAEEFTLYYRAGLISLDRHRVAPSFILNPFNGANPGSILFHHVRFKGLVKAPPVLDFSEKYEFLCQKRFGDQKFFITDNSASHRYSDGVQACKTESGVFVPPLTPLQWAGVLHQIKALPVDLPFPDPADSDIKGVWVAAQKGVGGDWHLPKEFGFAKTLFSTAQNDGEESSVVNRNGEYLSNYRSGNRAQSSSSAQNSQTSAAPASSGGPSSSSSGSSASTSSQSSGSSSQPAVAPEPPEFSHVACQENETRKISFNRSSSARCGSNKTLITKSKLRGLVNQIEWVKAAEGINDYDRIYLPQ